MADDPEHDRSHEQDVPHRASAAPPETAQGFTTAEKALGVAAAYKHPLISSVAASAMLDKETDPQRRRQLSSLRKGALVWWGVGAAFSLVILIVVLIVASNFGGSGDGGCKGAVDKTDIMGTTYTSDDDNHWMASYPCDGGGSTTVPVPRNEVPGVGR